MCGGVMFDSQLLTAWYADSRTLLFENDYLFFYIYSKQMYNIFFPAYPTNLFMRFKFCINQPYEDPNSWQNSVMAIPMQTH